MTEALRFIGTCIINSEGRKTDGLIKGLGAHELAQLAAWLTGEGRGDLVTFTPAGEAADPETVEEQATHLREREARAIAVDAGIRASRFNAALPLGEIDGAYREARGWLVPPESLYDWIDAQRALAAEPDVELFVQPASDPEPQVVQRRVPNRRLLWGQFLLCGLALLLVVCAVLACVDFVTAPRWR